MKTGVRLGVRRDGARGRPAWRGRLVVALVVVSAVLGGVAVESGVATAPPSVAGATSDADADGDAGVDGASGDGGGVVGSRQVDVDVATLPGTGTPGDPYRIANVSELQAMAADLDAHYVLVADVDASGTAGWNDGAGFAPVGDDAAPFTGSFDGAGFVVSGLTVDRPGTSAVGLFGVVDGARVANVTLAAASVVGEDRVGGLVGRSEATAVERVVVTGSVAGGGEVGGLVGVSARGSVNGSHATANVTGVREVGGLVGRSLDGTVGNATAAGSVRSTDLRAGGLVGTHDGGTIRNSHATADVTGAGEAGGLVGFLDGRVAHSVAAGRVEGSGGGTGGLVGTAESGLVRRSHATGEVAGTDRTGGLVGWLRGEFILRDSSATGDVVGSGDEVGGLIGAVRGGAAVFNSFAAGDVAGSSRVGGLVGANTGLVSGGYARGDVTGVREVGGLVGANVEGPFGSGSVGTSYATGRVAGGSGDGVGGLVGAGDPDDVDGSYWDVETSGVTTSAGGTGLATADLTGAAPLETDLSSFGRLSRWRLTASYPALRWEEPPAFLGVALTGTTSPVSAGDALAVDATVTNHGGAPGSGAVALTDAGFADSRRDATAVALDLGESTSVTLRWRTRPDDAGVGTVAVATANDSDAAVVRVVDGPLADWTLANVTVASAPNGLSTYRVEVRVPGREVTAVTPVLFDESTTDAEVVVREVDDGSGVDVYGVVPRGTVGPFADARTLFSVNVSGDVGEHEVELTVRDLVDGRGEPTNASLVGVDLTRGFAGGSPFDGPVPGVDGRAPTDPDGDGLYEDVDGDGVADLDDVFDLAFADHAAVNAVPARREALDFDGSGAVDLDDAFELAFAD